MEVYALTYLVSPVPIIQNPMTSAVRPIQHTIILVRPVKTKVSEQLIKKYYIYIQLMYTYF